MEQGVIFDMDGVLVDSGPAHHRSWQILAGRHGRSVSAERFAQTFGRPSRDIIRVIWGQAVSAEQIRRLDEEKEAIYRQLIADHIPLLPGCRAALGRLRQAGLRLAVATSGPPENLELVLSEGLIASYFDAEVHGFDVTRGKPAPDCFLLAARRLELPPSACVVVEDAPVGIQAAVSAGMSAIGLAGTHPEPVLRESGAKWVIHSLEELTPELVRQLLGAASGSNAEV